MLLHAFILRTVSFCSSHLIYFESSHNGVIIISALHLHLPFQVDDPIDMLPKSRKALSIQEIAALARSSFNGMDVKHLTLFLSTCS